MMQPIAKQTFEATVGLSEAEVRVLAEIASFDPKLVAKVLREQFTQRIDGDVLEGLLRRWGNETSACIRRFDAARLAFNGKTRCPTSP